MPLTLKVEPQEKVFVGPYILSSTEQTKLTMFLNNVQVFQENYAFKFHGPDAPALNTLVKEGMEQAAQPLLSGNGTGVNVFLSADGEQVERRIPSGTVGSPLESIVSLLVGRTVGDVERELILETLRYCLGNRTRAANILGISIRTLRYKLNEYGALGLSIPAPYGAKDGRHVGWQNQV